MKNHIIDNKFFIKKVSFRDEEENICELTSFNREINKIINGKSILSIEVIFASYRELSNNDHSFTNKDLKKYISKVEAEQLKKLISIDESAFINKLNTLIQ